MNTWKPLGTIASFVLLFWASPNVMTKEPDSIGKPPPLAKTTSDIVYLRQPKEISLTIAGRVVEPLSFLIRKPPAMGTLSAPRRTGRNSAVVTYTPRTDAVPGSDSFTFAAQSVDSPVSAAARVWIRLAEAPPDLMVPPALDFGTVFLGDTAEKILTLSNKGSGPARGAISLPSPWSVKGKPEYDIPAKSKAELHVSFAPAEEGIFRQSIRFENDPQKTATLSGLAARPISVPTEITEVTREQRAAGALEIPLTNHTDSQRDVRFQWPEHIVGPSSMSLEPGESKPLKIAFVEPVPLPREKSINFSSGGYSGTVSIKLPPTPARFSTRPAGTLQLGKARPGGTLRGRFTVRNEGESNTPVAITAPSWVRISPSPEHIVLGEGQEAAFEVEVSRHEAASFSGSIEVTSPVALSARVAIEGAFQEMEQKNIRTPVAQLLNVPQTAPVTESKAYQLPPIDAAYLVSASPHEILIEWPHSQPEVKHYKLQRRVLRAGASPAAPEWVDWSNPQITISADTVTAALANIPANETWIVRIVGLSLAREQVQESLAFQIATPPIPESRWGRLMLVLGTIVAIGVFVRLFIKARKLARERESGRIAALESERDPRQKPL